MKVAFITDDGKTISRHFGRAGYYLVVEVEEGEVVNKEMREKLGHRQFTAAEEPHTSGEGHGMGAESHRKHQSMAEVISDCKALVCGGMGMGAYQSMQSLGITPIVTQMSDIDAALKAYLKGELTDQTDMLH
jgi:predicted Fe-Mo cluster-binding NifX family protein